MSDLLTIQDLAKKLRISTRQVHLLRRAGQLFPHVMIGKRGIRWRPEDLARFLDAEVGERKVERAEQ